ncbi:cobyrinate a,c-diamide synthase [Pelagovum pacificum]|uniref:Cobyrinate a,c-diamide synthase n=1 Tax=Pelagovum pacificum TaxID=2588711 RepID=A0A5C5GDR2_9RHOB|nr:cobyrinate a,c-diamide synthase [Pelagovum pacificum]QQA44573.1 cobyrinate a,c-diamide synthase [Pelagovum pacificum]TNY32314.1 cobyrinate a,c-diamide synthase [Pelagovum pacificum]
MSGLILAAPSSGSGKTTVTLGLLRALHDRGLAVRAAKSGPDYIDPRFHEAACHTSCCNLDAWAMSPERLRSLAAGPGPLIVEGAMGLFDAATDGRGATADLARHLGLPVVLVIDAARMAQSALPLVKGFRDHDAAVRVAGVILNNVGSDRHEAMLRRALAQEAVDVFGAVRRAPDLAHPSRHLGLVQAAERADLDDFLATAARRMEASLDIDPLLALAETAAPLPETQAPRTPPPAASIALANDAAFAFAYLHLLDDWRRGGATIQSFSPLADEPAPKAELVLLPGGYPELHAPRLAAATTFLQSLRNRRVHGECGGYMVMGDWLTDADGMRHRMAGLLRLETSFAERRLHLGYRRLQAETGPFAGKWAAHEFHYATTVTATGTPLFTAEDAEGNVLPAMGLIEGPASGSFAHLIDRLS